MQKVSVKLAAVAIQIISSHSLLGMARKELKGR